MAADDVPMPADQGGRLDDHETLQQLCVLHSYTREQQSQLLGAAQPRALSQLALQDEHLLTEDEDLAVTIVTEQAREQGSKGREQCKKEMPEHTGRMRGAAREVNIGAEHFLAAAGGSRGGAD